MQLRCNLKYISYIQINIYIYICFGITGSELTITPKCEFTHVDSFFVDDLADLLHLLYTLNPTDSLGIFKRLLIFHCDTGLAVIKGKRFSQRV